MEKFQINMSVWLEWSVLAMAHVYVVHWSMDILSNLYRAYLLLSNLLVIMEYNIYQNQNCMGFIWSKWSYAGENYTTHKPKKNNDQFPWNMSAIIKYLVSQLIYRSVYVDLFEIPE